ncbi:MAG: exodeoxyribonuclease VII small subunit [Candidatus Eremiobacteraeota bacterium]|nr:exodeoxyribonuclease VII small subunit [Candidatus Eremiobacteraeota bacterium]
MSDKRSSEFESSMKRLEEIVAKLDSGEVDLDESVDLFKQGIALSRRCEELLKIAQDQIDEALNSDGKAPVSVLEDSPF